MRVLALSLLVAFASASLVAQTTNDQSILGSIEDSTGAVVPRATVTVLNQETNLSRSSVSNESGNYIVTNLPIGFYEVSATAPGFKKFVLTRVEVTVGQQATVNVTLQIGNVNESVTVQADAVRVESSSGEVSNLITGTQASQIQLNGRNFPQLLQLLPGVSTTYSSGFSLFGGTGLRTVDNPSTGAAPIHSPGIWTVQTTRTTAAEEIISSTSIPTLSLSFGS